MSQVMKILISHNYKFNFRSTLVFGRCGWRLQKTKQYRHQQIRQKETMNLILYLLQLTKVKKHPEFGISYESLTRSL